MANTALPGYLKLWWLCASPLSIAIATRVVWEKITLIHTTDPQLNGFSVTHLYPTFGIMGMLCCFSLLVWLLDAAPYVIAGWRKISFGDVVMLLLAIFSAIAAVIPERFFA